MPCTDVDRTQQGNKSVFWAWLPGGLSCGLKDGAGFRVTYSARPGRGFLVRRSQGGWVAVTKGKMVVDVSYRCEGCCFCVFVPRQEVKDRQGRLFPAGKLVARRDR